MKNVALRISKYGATANSISPGGVITPLNKHILESEELYSQVLNETLLMGNCGGNSRICVFYLSY